MSFFLLDYVEGSTDDHDHEVTEARWVPLEQARTELTYPGERDMVSERHPAPSRGPIGSRVACRP